MLKQKWICIPLVFLEAYKAPSLKRGCQVVLKEHWINCPYDRPTGTSVSLGKPSYIANHILIAYVITSELEFWERTVIIVGPIIIGPIEILFL